MAVTASGIWHPDPGDAYSNVANLATMAESIEDAVGPYVSDTGWIQLSYASGYSGPAPVIRRVGQTVLLEASTISGPFPVGTSNPITDIPTQFRPPHTIRGGAYLTSSRVGLSGVESNGRVSVINATGVACTSSQISLVWFLP